MIALIVIVVVFFGLLGAGAADNSGAAPVDAPPDNCYVCVKLESWWSAIPWWRRAYSWLWYLANHLVCLAKGCHA